MNRDADANDAGDRDLAALEHSGHNIALPNGLTFFVPAHHSRAQAEYLRREVFAQQSYRSPGFELRSDDTVIDVGGNLGLFALWAAPQVPDGRVISVEPTDAIDHLETNVRRNKLRNVATVHTAVGRDGGEIEVLYYPSQSALSHGAEFQQPLVTRILARCPLFKKSKNAPVRVKVRTVSLGSIMEEFSLQSVGYLKVDCEGGEYDIVRNMTSSEWKRIDRVALEFHEFDRSQRHAELVARLRGEGFEVKVCRPFLRYRMFRTGMIWARRII